MNFIRHRIDKKLQFWAALGPCLIILILLVNLIRYCPECSYLPWAILAGIPACWFWRVKGLVGAISLLLLMVFFAIGKTPLDERLWHLGVVTAVALSFVGYHLVG